MKKLLLIPALLAGTLAFSDQNKYEISPMIGYDFAEGNLNIKDNGYLLGGVEVQFNTPDSKISPELSVLYSQGVDYKSGKDTKIARGAFNGVYTFDAMNYAVPFAKIGAGIEKISTPSASVDDGFFLDAGAGAKVPLTKNLALKLEAIYMAKVNRDNAGRFDSNLLTMVGLTFAFGGDEQKTAPKEVVAPAVAPVVQKKVEEKVVPVVMAVVILDDDKDGIINANDKCLNTIKGAKVDANGCELDDDKDGIVNSQDSCSNTAKGIKVDAKGCNADIDNDGILNANDICPNTLAGEAVNSDGCPKTVALNVNFENNSDKIKVESVDKINKYADFLKKYTNYSAKIVGYTDSRGSASYNQKLSEKRAKAVVATLKSNGVNAKQLSSFGAGEKNPIATNRTAKGRAQNRRIEAVLTRD